MARTLYEIGGEGISDGKVWYLSGSSLPGGDSGPQDEAPVGSWYSHTVDGTSWKKVTAGAGFDKWLQLPFTTGDSTVPEYKKLLDAVGSLTYVGEALPGTSTTAAAWRIKLIDESTEDLTILWAEGTAAFDKAWDQHLSYGYS